MIILIFCLKVVAIKHYLSLGLSEMNNRKNIWVRTWGICATHKERHSEWKNASAKPRAEMMMFECLLSQNKLTSYWNSSKTSWKQWEDSQWFSEGCGFHFYMCICMFHSSKANPQRWATASEGPAEFLLFIRGGPVAILTPPESSERDLSSTPATLYTEQWVMAWALPLSKGIEIVVTGLLRPKMARNVKLWILTDLLRFCNV